MSKKDFELIAAVLRSAAEEWPNDPNVRVPVQSEFASLRLAFAEALQDTNPRFDVSRFLNAAQPRPDAYEERLERYRKLRPL